MRRELESDYADGGDPSGFQLPILAISAIPAIPALAFPIKSDFSDPASHGEPASGSLEWDHGDGGDPPCFQLPILAISAILVILGPCFSDHERFQRSGVPRRACFWFVRVGSRRRRRSARFPITNFGNFGDFGNSRGRM